MASYSVRYINHVATCCGNVCARSRCASGSCCCIEGVFVHCYGHTSCTEMIHFYIIFVSRRHASNFHRVVHGLLGFGRDRHRECATCRRCRRVSRSFQQQFLQIHGRQLLFRKWCSRHQYHHQSQNWLAFAHLHALWQNISLILLMCTSRSMS